MTKTQIIAAVVANVGNRDDKDDVIATGIDLAVEEVTKTHDFSILKTVVDIETLAETAYVALPEGTINVQEVRVMNGINSYDLDVMNREQVLRDFPDADSRSTSYPQRCYIQGLQLFIVPRISFDTSVRMTVISKPAFDDTDDGQELSPFIEGLDKYFIAYATSWVFLSMQMAQLSTYWMSIALNALDGAITQDRRKPSEKRLREPVQTMVDRYIDPEDPFNGSVYGSKGTGPYGT